MSAFFNYLDPSNILTVVEDLQKGIQEKIDLVTQQENAWKHISLNIGLVGKSGPGKSAFINRLCGTKNTVSRIARPVTKPTKYFHPKNNNVAFWDLPAVGEPGFLKADYLAKTDLTRCHFVILFSEVPFSGNEVWLAGEMQRRGLSYFCVQTASGKAPSPAQVNGKKVYVVDTSRLGKWGFPQLMEDINDLLANESLDQTRRLALMLTLEPMSKKLIQLKADALKRRAMIVATMAAARSGGLTAIPIVGAALKVCLDPSRLGEEFGFYTEQFGLVQEFLNYMSQQLGISSGIDDIDSHVGDYVKKVLSTTTEGAVTKAAQFVVGSLPGAGPLASAVTSFGAAYLILTQAIDVMQKLSEEAATE